LVPMVASKKEKKGTGAAKRRAEASSAQQGQPFRKEKKENREKRPKKKKKAAGGKGVAENNASSPSLQIIARVVRRVCAVAFALCVFSRGNFGEAFGHGTGINRANLTPVSLVAYAGMNAEFVKSDNQMKIKAKILSRALMLPGEAIGPRLPKKMRPPAISKKFGGQGPNDPLSDKARASLDALLADKAMPKLMQYQSKDILLGGALACIIGAATSPVFLAADNINMIGLILFYVGTSQTGGRIVPLFWCAAGTLVVSQLAGYFDVDTEAAPKRKYRRKKRRAQESDDEESDDEDDDAAEAAGAEESDEGESEGEGGSKDESDAEQES
jgi:hypothetical protein